MLRKGLFIGVVITGFVILGGLFFNNSQGFTKEKVIGGFVADNTQYTLLEDTNKYDEIYISLRNEKTSKIHAISGWFEPKGDMSYDCKDAENCIFVTSYDLQTNVASGMKLSKYALRRTLSKQQIEANRTFGFKVHKFGVANKTVQKAIRKFPPSENGELNGKGLRI